MTAMEFTDSVELGNTRTTRDGYLLVDAKVARTGIQTYLGREVNRPNIAQVNIWRPEEEVFSQDALTSLAYRPVTNDHPDHMVDASSWREVAVGMTGDMIARDGEYIRLPFTMMDADSISAVKAGKRQLSLGYTANIEWTSGETPDGHVYDAIMRQIRGNHLAVVDAARAGPSCRIGDGWSQAQPTPTTARDRNMPDLNLRTVMVDGLSIQVTDQGAQAIEKLQRQIADMSTANGRRDAEFSALRDAHAAALNSVTQTKDGEIAGLKATHSSAIEAKDGEIAGLKSSHASALAAKDGEIDGLKAKQPDAAQMDALIADRANIIDSARKILGDKFDPKGKSNADVRRAAVEKRLGASAVSDKSDDYIGAAFDTLTAVGAGAPPGRDPVRDHFVNTSAPRNQSQDMNDADAAHDRYVADMRNAWKSKAKESV